MSLNRSPIVCARTWNTVMLAAGHCCQCTGACGNKHTKTGLRCDRDLARARLIAAPADLALSPLAAARVPVAELRAWCPDCHRKASTRHRADAARVRALTATDTPTLFDI